MGRDKFYSKPVKVIITMEEEEKELFEQRARMQNFRTFTEFVITALRDKCRAINSTEEIQVSISKLEAEKKSAEHQANTKTAELALAHARLEAVSNYTIKTTPEFEKEYREAVNAVYTAITNGREGFVAEGRAEYLSTKFKRAILPEKLMQEAYLLRDSKKTEGMFR